MSENPVTKPAPPEPLRQLSEALRTLEGRMDPNELARRTVRAALAQPGVTGARLWRVEEGRSCVWAEQGQFPPADVTNMFSQAAAGVPTACAQGFPIHAEKSSPSPAEDLLIWTSVLGSDDFRMRVLEARGSRALDSATRIRLDVLASFAAVALALAERRGAVEELSSIVEATKRLNSTLDLAELISIILQIATRQTGAERGTVFLVDYNREEIWSLVGLGIEQQEIRLPSAKGIAGWVAHHGKSVNLADAYDDPRFEPEIDRRLGFRTGRLLCLPIRNKDSVIIGVLQLLNKHSGDFTETDERFLDALSAHVALALENAQLHRERLAKQRMERDLELARTIQARFLPEQPPQIPGFELGISHHASQMVGGDYYDFVRLDSNILMVVVADVEGKGVASALVMANLQATLRALVGHVHALERLVTSINQMILSDTRASKYMSMFIGLLDQKRRALHYINAGHVPPALIRANGSVALLEQGGTLVGLFPDVGYERGTLQLDSGDILVACTDGITEAMDARELEYGRARLIESVERLRSRPAQEIVNHILNEVQTFSRDSSYEDDRVLFVMKVQ
ncbi:MAG TPA: GAF domain-containing SpoIIE family protein phosphatase [Candidatus Dormibacteraeota bacterium]|nr:GAF domain-containing SpoIIE family protein phosphatase [Candidatus Dormibacteraeota bacterium]